jgi:hypothetical protein
MIISCLFSLFACGEETFFTRRSKAYFNVFPVISYSFKPHFYRPDIWSIVNLTNYHNLKVSVIRNVQILVAYQ